MFLVPFIRSKSMQATLNRFSQSNQNLLKYVHLSSKLLGKEEHHLQINIILILISQTTSQKQQFFGKGAKSKNLKLLQEIDSPKLKKIVTFLPQVTTIPLQPSRKLKLQTKYSDSQNKTMKHLQMSAPDAKRKSQDLHIISMTQVFSIKLASVLEVWLSKGIDLHI